MKNKFFLIIFIFLSHSVFSQYYFEGVIKFKIDISTNKYSYAGQKEDLTGKFGDTLVMLYAANGDFKREFINTTPSGKEYEIFNAKKKILFVKNKNQENPNEVDVTINSLDYINKQKLPNQDILGLNCECNQYNGSIKDEEALSIIFCHTKSAPEINFVAYEHYADFFLNDFFITTQRPYLKYVIKAEDYTITFTAISLEDKKLDKKYFKVNKIIASSANGRKFF